MRSLLFRWLWLSVLALAVPAEALDLGPYGSLTANTVSAALVVTGLPAADSATVASLTSGTPATPKPGFRLFKPKPQSAPAVPVFDEVVVEEEAEAAAPRRRPRRPRLFDTGEIDMVHGHAVHDHDHDDDCHECEAADEAHDRLEYDRFSISAEALLLKRDQTQNVVLAQAITPAGAPNGGGTLFLDAVQNFNNENGFRTDITWRFSPDSAIQVAYFGQNEWAESAQVSAAAPNAFVQSPFLGTTIATPDERFDSAIEADYNSQVHDGQLNWVHSFSQCPDDENKRWLLGLRTFIFRDELLLIGVQTGGAVTERTSAVCYNEFFGPQFGVDLNHPVIDDKVTLGLASKAGLFVNFAELRLRNIGFPGTGQPGTTFIDLTDNHTGLGQIVEAALQIRYRPFRWLTLRGGYQVLYARGLSLAPSQLLATGTSIRDVPQTTFPGAIPGGIDNDNTITLDGAFAGGEFRF